MISSFTTRIGSTPAEELSSILAAVEEDNDRVIVQLLSGDGEWTADAVGRVTVLDDDYTDAVGADTVFVLAGTVTDAHKAAVAAGCRIRVWGRAFAFYADVHPYTQSADLTAPGDPFHHLDIDVDEQLELAVSNVSRADTRTILKKYPF